VYAALREVGAEERSLLLWNCLSCITAVVWRFWAQGAVLPLWSLSFTYTRQKLRLSNTSVVRESKRSTASCISHMSNMCTHKVRTTTLPTCPTGGSWRITLHYKPKCVGEFILVRGIR
jgi:hypothetical protein